MDTFSQRYALVRPVPDSYARCVRRNVEKINVRVAKKQHLEYCEALERLGLELVLAESDNALPDSCFVEDTAVIFGEKAVICNMRVESRAKETIGIVRVLEEFKKIYQIEAPAFIDGGDVLKIEDTVLVGLSARTNLQAIRQLRTVLKDCDLKIVPVRVYDVLHLKSACTYIGNDYVVLSRVHFDTGILRGLRKLVVPKGEEYAADCLAVNGTVLMAKGYPKTKMLIENEGFHVQELAMSEFHKGDGALTCLSIIW